MTVALLTLALLTAASTGLAWWLTFRLLRYTQLAEQRRDDERRELLNRLQIGRTQYPAAHVEDEYGSVDLDDDEAINQRMMTKEDLADLADRQAASPVLSIPPAVLPPNYNGG